MKSERTRRDVKRNCDFHKDVGHIMDICVALKDEIERLIRSSNFKEFVDEQHAANREERPGQRSLKKVHEVLTIIGGSHLARESRNVRDQYAKDAKTLQLVQVQKIEE